MADWPNFKLEAERFYGGHLARPRKLFGAFVPRQSGSGRPSGPRALYWPTTIALAVAALEAGLEDLLVAAHGRRQGAEGQPIQPGANSIGADPRGWLVEKRLMAPNRQKVEHLLFGDFGVLLGTLPSSARFTPMKKDWAKGGAGRGVPAAGPTNWSQLGPYLETMSHIRNATAHGDARKLGQKPTQAKGVLWVTRDDGNWSVQLPHALNSLRAVLSTFNTVAEALADSLAISPRPILIRPDTITFDAP